MSKSNKQEIPVASLTISPRLERILTLQQVDTDESREEYEAGLASVTALQKILQPLAVIIGTTEVVDGRHRLMWARDAGLMTVPVTYVTEEEAEHIIRAEIFARRSMSKSQKAWIHLLLSPEVADGTSDNSKDLTLETAAREAGVSRSLMKEAAALWRVLSSKKYAGAKGEPARRAVELRIFQGEGLGNILADIRPAPGAGKTEAAPLDAAAQAAQDAQDAANAWQSLLDGFATELQTTRSYALLDPLALHTASTALLGHTANLTLAAMARPDLTTAQKAHLLDGLEETLKSARKAAGLNK